MTKTCGECKHYTECNWVTSDVIADNCEDFEQKVITNGDKIIAGGNEGIAAFACGLLNDRSEETFQRVLSFLNAPAESEGGRMTPEEIELWKFAIEKICNAWIWGTVWLGLGGIGSVTVKNIIGRG